MRFSTELRKAAERGYKQTKLRLYDRYAPEFRCAIGATVPSHIVEEDIAWWDYVVKNGNTELGAPPTERFLRASFPELSAIGNDGFKKCPHCVSVVLFSWNGVITHLNDEHNWSFEQIADWYDEMFPEYDVLKEVEEVLSKEDSKELVLV